MEQHETRIACGLSEEPRCVRLIVAEPGDIGVDRTKLRLGEREAIKVRHTVWERLTC